MPDAIPALGRREEFKRSAAFVQKHILTSIVERQPVAPLSTLRRYISAPLFVGVNGFLTVRSS